MKNIVCLFPGQGSQYVGMGKLLNDQGSLEILDEANEVLKFDLKKIMYEGPEEKLKKTKYTQPAILTHSYLIFRKLKKALDEKNLKINYVLGHSVGEYSALVAAEAMSFSHAVQAVHFRGKFMQEAVAEGDGSMLAVLKIPASEIENICKSVSTTHSIVMPANINSPGQVVVSGHSDACAKLIDWLKNNYSSPYRVVPLKVSAPFHSSLMKPAEERLLNFFNEIEFNSNKISYIDNVTASKNPVGTSGNDIKNKLVQQVSGTVQWNNSIRNINPEDTLFLEVGPGKTLMGICRSIDRAYKVFPLDIENLDEGLLEIL